MKKIALYIVVGLVAIACSPKTVETVTEPITEAPMPKADIGEGKVVYLKDCSKCHELKTIENFTPEQWSKILPSMIKKAGINEEKARQVTAYVDWKLSQK